MPKVRVPEVEIELGGVVRHLIYDFNAMAELQDVAGTFESAVPRLKIIRAALWAGLLAETLDAKGRPTKRTLSIMDVGNLLAEMSSDEIETLSGKIMEARGLAEAKPEERPTPATENPQP